MSPPRALGGVEGALAIAQVTLVRLRRGASVWVALALATLPLLFALTRKDHDLAAWGSVVATWGYLLAILPPVLLASAIGEEIEERTMAYLWSRPLPRWSIVAGKVIAVVPVLWLLLAAALVAPLYVAFGDHAHLLGRSLATVALGTAAAAAVTAGIATLVPRHATIVSLAYLVTIDRSLAWFDASICKLSVTYDAMRLSGVYEEAPAPAVSVAWLVGIGVAWMAIAAWRVRRLE